MIYYLFDYNPNLKGVNKKIVTKIYELRALGLDVKALMVYSNLSLNLSEYDDAIFEKYYLIKRKPKSRFLNNLTSLIFEFRKNKNYYDFIYKKLKNKKFELLIKRYGNEDINSFLFQKKINNKIIYEINTLQGIQNIKKWNYKGVLFSQPWVSYIVKSELYFGEKCLKNAKAIIAVTNEIQKNVIETKMLNPEKSFFISNGTSLKSKCAKSNMSSTINLLMILGVDSFWNGEELLIDSIQSFNKDKFKLYIVGNIKSKNTSKNIIYLGSKNPSDLFEIIDKYKIHIGVGTLALQRKGIFEASPLKVREYLSYGLPVLYNYFDSDLESDPTFRNKFCIKLEESQIDLKKVIEKFNEIQKIKNYNIKIKEWAERNVNSKIKMKEYKNIIEQVIN